MRRKFLQCGSVTLCLLLLCGGAAWSKDVGQIISHKAGLAAERGGQRVELALKSPVAETDTLMTDATGKAQVLFEDDTTVTLSPNTSLRLDTVVAEGKSPVFKAHMGQGMARFITGKIVEKNPEGFSVVTPEATVGIRGTMFVVQVGNGQTTVYVLNTTKQVYVSGILVPTSFKITLPHGSPVPMTPEDMSRVNGNLAAREPAVRAAGPVAAADVPLTTSLTDAPLNTQMQAEALKPPQPADAYVAGSLTGTQPGIFNFMVNLGSGAVSNGLMKNPAFGTLTGGSGSISGSSLAVTGFTNGSNTGSMHGTASTGPHGLSVSGSYLVQGLNSDSGTFVGQQQ